MSRRRLWELGSTLLLLFVLGSCAGYAYYLHRLNLELAEVLTPDGFGLTGSVQLTWNTKRAMQLVRQGAFVKTRGRGGATVLSVAAGDGNYDLVEELLHRGAEVNTRDEGGMTPLISAADGRNERLMRLLIANGADPNIPNSATRWTPLFYLIVLGTTPQPNSPRLLNCTKILLNAGADTKLVDYDGRTVLDYAADKGETQMLHLLRQAGAEKSNGVGRIKPSGVKE